ncbi:Aminopeptidase Q [Ooceraea biroi]|uniref:Aminopeptidase n=1 Tax=Ooceraea biroi TaxID=2015173 RepID=A0A026X2Y8_OOCBI|nr:Aminopeptidase Q [Ooceraea biroi]
MVQTPDYVRRHEIKEEENPRWWHVRARIVVMILICVVVASMIIYWFVNSIMENRRDGRYTGLASGKSHKAAHLNRLSDYVLPLEYTVSEYRLPNASKLISKYVMTDEEDFIDVFLLQMLMAGETYILHVKYTIPLHEIAIGFFRNAHIDPDTNETRWIAVSNFSPNYARTAYPCFDEPWIKTPFRISIGRKSSMRSHSNSIRKITEEMHDMPGYVWDHYEKTLPMPTYVVAFMVTDYFSYDVGVTDRPSHAIISRKEVANETKYVGQLLPKVLRLIQNFTGFHYELDKLDVIIVPELAYSAMENWGLITFRENIALIKDDYGVDSKKVCASIMAHEVAHQWFGNLVTPKWWDDVWLKEGFSSFFGFLAMSVLEPESWELQASFLIECHDVFDIDAYETYAHPLHIDLRYLNELNGVFDLTSYVKGNCMARMIYHFLGERIFLSSVRRYMRTYYYRSADQEDLWSAFQAEIDRTRRLPASSRLSMKDVMRTWTYQAGFPVLQVRQNRETGAIELTQDRFYHYGLNSTSEELWHVPLTWTTENEQQFGNNLPKAWMVKKRMKINDTALSRASSNNQWILFNINQTALYRVNYDVENWKLLAKSFRALPEVVKVQVLSDSFAMADAKLLDKRVMWNILEKLEAESGETLWTIAMIFLTTIQNRLWDSNALEFSMCKFIEKVYTKSARSLIYMDPALWTKFKINLMSMACSVGHRTCLTTIFNLARKMLQDNFSSSLSYCTLMKVTTDEQWLALLKRYNESTVHDKESLAFALGCHANASLLQGYLSVMFSQNNITQAETALRSVASNPFGFRVAMGFLTENWDKFNENATADNENYANVTLARTLHAISRRIRQKEDMEWLRRLQGSSVKYDTWIGQVINSVRTNVAWYQEQRNETLKILEEISMRHVETRDCRKRD